MMLKYQETPPSLQFAHGIECFWSLVAFSEFRQTIHPDGCTDILLRCTRSEKRLDVIGTMTRPQTVNVSKGGFFFGVRFKPGMAVSLLPGYQKAASDQEIPFEVILPKKNRKLWKNICNADSSEEKIALLEQVLNADIEPSLVQKAVARIHLTHGMASLEELCDIAHLGERQFRRACKKITGVSPKTLSRILRFRSTKEKLESNESINFALLAAEKGYFDQAHMLHDFKQFAGCSPTKIKTFSK